MSGVKVAGRRIELSNTDKLFFPADRLTKGDLIDYYREVANVMVPHVAQRPLALHRFPDGIGAEGFFQQQCSEHFPDWLESVTVERVEAKGKRRSIEHPLCNDAAALVYLADQAAIVLHGWLARASALEYPDRLIFDLDPPGSDFTPVRAAARAVADLMERLGLAPHVMTTGSSGLHVVAPLTRDQNFEQVRALAQDMAAHLAAAHPEELTTAHYKDERHGRIYLDVLRNAYGQTTVMPYAVRAKPGAPVATPLALDELANTRLDPQRYHLGNIRNRLGQKADPWRDIERHAASAEAAARRFGEMEAP